MASERSSIEGDESRFTSTADKRCNPKHAVAIIRKGREQFPVKWEPAQAEIDGRLWAAKALDRIVAILIANLPA
jgi:hypothetical protein